METLPYIRNLDLRRITFASRDLLQAVSSCRESYQAEEVYPTKTYRHREIPIWRKSSLTIDEAAEYSGVGRARLRQLTDREDCPFVLWVGSKRLIRREKLDQYLDKVFSI